jgi:glycosyltransferase involved in cell wall biosynthesis
MHFPVNVKTISAGTAINDLLRLKWWLDIKVKRILKRWQADIFLSLDGTISLSVNIPQLVGFTGIDLLHDVKKYSAAGMLFRKFYLPRYLQKAASIIVVSDAVKQALRKKYRVTEKFVVIPKAASPVFQHLTWEQKIQVKEKYTGGREFFLFTGGFERNKNLLNTLKAFSQFKKWQQSEMKLVITGDTVDATGEIMQKMETFKFRKDVILFGHVEDNQLAALMGAAYGLVYPSLHETFGMAALEAMQSGTAVIVSDITALHSTCGEAALYVDPSDPGNISAQMIKLYKDEGLRSSLIDAGEKQAAGFSWDTSAGNLWQLVEKTVTGKAG